MATKHSIIGLVEVLKWAESSGCARDILLANTGLSERDFQDPKATVSPQQELTFYRNLLATRNDPHALLESGFKLSLATYGLWGLALISSPTFRKAIELGIEFIDFTYTYNRIDLIAERDFAALRICAKEPLDTLERPMIERDISAAFVLFQTLLQTSTPAQRIRFPWPRLRAVSYYEDLFSCPVEFEQPQCELVFDAHLLNHELPQSNALTQRLCMEQLESIRPGLEINNSMTERVQHYLSSTPVYRVNMRDCAQQLGASERSLRRKLAQDNQSFQAMANAMRYALAQRYLSETSMTLEAIAQRLGFSDAANFSHAFKRWSGGIAPRATTHK